VPKLFYNADNIYTMNRERPVIENVLVEKGVIVDYNVEASESYEKIDLKGKTLVPGFIDSHLHTLMYGIELDMLDLSDTSSIKDLIAKTKKYIKKKDLKKGEWIIGWGWNQDKFENEELPKAKDLDKISTEYPIVLKRECRHLLVANSLALKKADITEATKVVDGKINLDSDGDPNGILRENAQKLVLKAAPETTVKDIKNYIVKSGKKFRENGLTFVQSDDLDDSNVSYKKVLQAYYELADSGQLPVRFNLQLRLTTIDQLNEFLSEHKLGKYNDFLTLGPLKIWADGSLGARTAALRESYTDRDNSFGELLCSKEKMEKMAKIAFENEMQIACHAIGDRTIEQFIEVIESLNKEYDTNLRHRIIHSQLADYKLLKRMKKAGINTDIQPAFTVSDWKIVANRLGKRREQQSYLWKNMLDLNINTAGSSDCPIEKPDPIWGISCAVTRKDKDKKPDHGWLPQQKITVQDALEIYTKNAAYNAFEEKDKGKIEVGYKADFTIIDQNPFLIKADELRDINIEATVIGGEIYPNKKSSSF
jgi:hypothetical protein